MYLRVSTSWVEVVLVQLSWTTASWYSAVMHRIVRVRQTSQVASHCRDYGGCPGHSSEALERASELCTVFYASLRAHLVVRTL